MGTNAISVLCDVIYELFHFSVVFFQVIFGYGPDKEEIDWIKL
jgi:hypothetical protein